MSYLEYFIENIQNKEPHNNEAIRGHCNTMCPQEEVEIRTRERLVHMLEVVNGNKKLVKSFCRSAADSTVAVPKLLRPFHVLKDTVQYLLFEVTQRTNMPLGLVYDFVNDRLRAVRQDMTIQRLPPEQNRILLEPMIRFYVYFGYRLCECPIKDFYALLNKKYLLECLKWFLHCTDILDKSEQSESVERLSDFLSNMQLKNTGKNLKCDRVLMETLYIMCNLDDLHPIFRYLQLPEKVKNKPALKLGYKLAIANIQGNFTKVTKLSKELCPLTLCAFNLYLPILQKKALLTMSHAYNSKFLSVPCETLRQWLLFNTDVEAIEACKHYGLKVINDRVHFGKVDFNQEQTVLPPKKNPLSEKLGRTTDAIFTYETDL